jgi:two-component system, NarL family, response regulator LiaR
LDTSTISEEEIMEIIKIVLIEDHDLTRVGMRTALQQFQDFDIVAESSKGKEGLALLEKWQPDIAIIDLGLPDMDGIEVTRRYKQIHPVQAEKTRVLVLTFNDHEDAVLAAFAAGADSYCVKDIRFDMLVDVIRLTHQGNCWIAHTRKRTMAENRSDGSVSSSGSEVNFNPLADGSPLTERELEVLQLIVDGYSNAIIAERLVITVGTVKTHVRNILNKLCADDRTQAAVRALRSGLVC